ncbi:unnamed protein product [Enterobius vermicularis]|uniref:Diphthine--ammonia ligase n=1 Tax=Enterobius vermicularis TaxID=51028 RepID=A0A0N4VE87_ENTVE|nr:unnamed protein product [Enterobius vermicularis]
MKVVGLVSGGKDSCYNMMKCTQEGHEIVCLANLYPSGGLDEVDSFMYQSVGYQGVQLYGEALELPLFRAEIRGLPLNQSLEYSLTKNDEVEDLYQLLVKVLHKFPDIKGVSAGAILSRYQKNRVENVCLRLGLKPLCKLWNVEQKSLLDEMIHDGISAILVKVATLGLDQQHIGKTLVEVRDRLLALNAKYGVSVCGEGGEYETFVLDCPLFKRRIVVDDYCVVTSSEDCGPVAYMRLEKFHLEPKS